MKLIRIFWHGLFAYLMVACVPTAIETPITTGIPFFTPTIEAPSTKQPYRTTTPIATVPNGAYPYPQATLNATDEAIISLKATMGVEMELTLTASPSSTPQPTGTHEFGDLWGISGWNLVIYVENTWYGIVNGKEVRVFSGSYTNSEQGVFFIMFPLAGYWFERIYETPTQSGVIRVIDEKNNRLKFLSNQGNVFYFDIPGLQFVSSFDEPVPTITPPSELTITPIGYP